MKKATGTALESDFGFKSPSFSVDALGNIIANSISTTEPIGSGTGSASGITNFKITELGGSFQVTGYEGSNPTIELERGKTYSFEIELTDLNFYVFLSNEVTQYTNIIDSDGNTGLAAQGRKTGIIQLTITTDTGDTLIYANNDRSVKGTFSIINPTGVFGGLSVTNTTNATGLSTGAVTVAGGASVSKDLYIGGNLFMEGTGDVSFASSTNLTLGSNNRVIFTIDSTTVGEITEDGFKTPLVNTTVNNTVIGNTTPAEATFTTASVTSTPTTVNNVTNKAYVDQQDIALSIALGS